MTLLRTLEGIDNGPVTGQPGQERRKHMICIYHHGCMDGFAAAWVVKKAYPDTNIEFIPARYGDEPPPVITGESIIVVDFSYPREVLLQMAEFAKHLVVIDHHKTAKEALSDLPFAHFDMSKSGAMLAWEMFFRDDEPPEFIKYIQDRDLWKFELPDSRAINAAMYSYPMDFDIWESVFFRDEVLMTVLRDEGLGILRMNEKHIKSLTSGWAIDRMDILGFTVPALNCPRWLASEALNLLAQNEPFAVGYFDSKHKRQFELRSVEGGVDVSEIAKHFGGGGHKHAAGFTIDKPIIFGGEGD